jgi:hypothetical protein
MTWACCSSAREPITSAARPTGANVSHSCAGHNSSANDLSRVRASALRVSCESCISDRHGAGSAVRPRCCDEVTKRRLRLLCEVKAQSDPCSLCQQWIDHTDHGQATLKHCSECSGPAERLAGLLGEINSAHDRMHRHIMNPFLPPSTSRRSPVFIAAKRQSTGDVHPRRRPRWRHPAGRIGWSQPPPSRFAPALHAAQPESPEPPCHRVRRAHTRLREPRRLHTCSRQRVGQ